MRITELFNPISCVVCELVDGDYALALYKRMDYSITFFYLQLKFLEKCGVVNSNKIGRIRKVYLTGRGKEMKEQLLKIKEILESNACGRN